MRDEQDTLAAPSVEPVDTVGDDPQRIDVQAGVGLVEDRDARVEELQLEDLVPLLLAAGEARVEVALGERRVDGEFRPWRS